MSLRLVPQYSSQASAILYGPRTNQQASWAHSMTMRQPTSFKYATKSTGRKTKGNVPKWVDLIYYFIFTCMIFAAPAPGILRHSDPIAVFIYFVYLYLSRRHTHSDSLQFRSFLPNGLGNRRRLHSPCYLQEHMVYTCSCSAARSGVRQTTPRCSFHVHCQIQHHTIELVMIGGSFNSASQTIES